MGYNLLYVFSLIPPAALMDLSSVINLFLCFVVGSDGKILQVGLSNNWRKLVFQHKIYSVFEKIKSSTISSLILLISYYTVSFYHLLGLLQLFK